MRFQTCRILIFGRGWTKMSEECNSLKSQESGYTTLVFTVLQLRSTGPSAILLSLTKGL